MNTRPASNTLRVVSLALATLVVAVSIVSRASHLSQRPIQHDELITLQNYTWAGIHSDGTRRELRRQADVDHLESLSLRRAALGLYCSLGRWPEPNNHVMHSLLTNVALLAPCGTLTAIRLPALVCCGAFALLCAWMCVRCGLLYSAPTVALLAMWHPYCILYSQESRGYALMLALCVGFVLALQRHTEHIKSLVSNALVIAIACASIENFVNLSVDWVLPVLVSAMVVPAQVLGASFDQDKLMAWRRSLVCQILVVGAIGGTFLMDRLPYVVSSAQQYGIRCSSMADLASYAHDTMRMFVPTFLWGVVFCCGLAGGARALLKKETRCLAAPWLVAAVVSAVHFAVARKLPYVRNLGYLLPAVVLGYGATIEALVTWCSSRKLQSALAIGATALSAWLFVASAKVDLANQDDIALAEKLAATDGNMNQDRILLLGHGVTNTVSLALSKQENEQMIASLSPQVQILLIEKATFPFLPELQLSQGWDSRQVEQVGSYRIHRLEYKSIDPRDYDGHSTAVCIWYPTFESVSVTDQVVLDAVKKAGLLYSPGYTRYQAKMEVFGRLNRIVVDVSDPTHASAIGARKIDRMKSIVERFGGKLFVLIPQKD